MVRRSEDHSDHTERIEHIIDDTQENLNEARAFEREHGEVLSEEEKRRIEEKNHNRAESMENMGEAIQNEKRHEQ